MSGRKEKNLSKKQKQAYAILILSVIGVLVFNLLTPMMTDDYSYGAQVKEAAGLFDLFRQEAHQYMTWNGRSVVHLLLRIMLSLPPVVFKILNTLVFGILSLCIGYFVCARGEKVEWDPFAMLLIQLGLWLFTVDFSETVLWETGAVNYLWGTTIIFGFMTCVTVLLRRQELQESSGTDLPGSRNEKNAGKNTLLLAGIFLFGLIAGWCNENTSGGCLLYMLYLMWKSDDLEAADEAEKNGQGRRLTIPPLLRAAAAGNLLGLAIMILSPGGRARAAFTQENHSGLYGLFARFQKTTLTVREYFLPLLAALLVLWIVWILLEEKKRSGKGASAASSERSESGTGALFAHWKEDGTVPLFVFLFLATTYAIILTVQPQPRAYFGAGIFLLIAVIRQILDVREKEAGEADPGSAGSSCSPGSAGIAARMLCYGTAAVLTLSFLFTYIDCGAQLARINRDSKERVEYIEQKKAEGADEIIVAQLHPAFENRYTVAYESDLVEDDGYWTNVAYETYFEVESISAIPYDDWALIR